MDSTQNIIALIWDFDKTLIPYYMQMPIFEEYGVDANSFWNEVNNLKTKYAEQNIKINPENIYLNQFILYAKRQIFKNLDNTKIKNFGSKLDYFPGAPEILKNLKDQIESDEIFSKHDIKVENYIVSTGFAELIRGSRINEFADGIWGCEFIENAIYRDNEQWTQEENEHKSISYIAYAIDNTTKTRAIFEINKGVNKNPKIDVNQNMSEKLRRIPIQNMIYIADGPSDVPAFSVVRKGGGKTLAVYNGECNKSYTQAKNLHDTERVDYFSEANYSAKSPTHRWLSSETHNIAKRIAEARESELMSGSNTVPKHF